MSIKRKLDHVSPQSQELHRLCQAYEDVTRCQGLHQWQWAQHLFNIHTQAMADALQKLVQRNTNTAGYKRKTKCGTDFYWPPLSTATDWQWYKWVYPLRHWSSFMKKENPVASRKETNKAIRYPRHSGSLLHKLREKEKNEDIHQQRVESRTAKGIAASNTRSSWAWQNNIGGRNRKEKRRTITHTTIRRFSTLYYWGIHVRGKLKDKGRNWKE